MFITFFFFASTQIQHQYYCKTCNQQLKVTIMALSSTTEGSYYPFFKLNSKLPTNNAEGNLVQDIEIQLSLKSIY